MHAPLPQSRVNALWSLEGLHALVDADILVGLNDPVAEVRAESVKLAAPRLGRSAVLLERVLGFSADPDQAVRFQTALALGSSADPRVADGLLQIARRDAANRWISAAVLCSATVAAPGCWSQCGMTPSESG